MTNSKTAKMKGIMKVIIDRGMWACYEAPPGETMMLNSMTQRLCCMGHISLAQGVSRDALADRRTPEATMEDYYDGTVVNLGWMVEANEADDDRPYRDSKMAAMMITANDNQHITLDQREDTLIQLAAKENIELEFTGSIHA